MFNCRLNNNDDALDLAWINDGTSAFRVSLGTTASSSQSYGIQELTGVNVLTRASAVAASLVLKDRASQLEVLQGQASAGEARFDTAANFASVMSDEESAASEKITEVDVAKEVAALVAEEVRSKAQQYALRAHALESRRVLELLQDV
jgi:flagellin-like hook-associated protein FlgL